MKQRQITFCTGKTHPVRGESLAALDGTLPEAAEITLKQEKVVPEQVELIQQQEKVVL
ncbi:hypothetical protein VU04_06560 [Desulfobulbus sp. TB]|nr:hypothetical protein [Desulfobulbus sp. TB]